MTDKKSLTNLKGSTSFKCPNCGKTEVIRTIQERKIATRYQCSECSFEGPN